MKITRAFVYKYQWTLLILVVLSNSNVFAQVSPLQQPPPPAGSHNETPGNVIEKLFSNPAANSSYASLYASPNSNSPYASVDGVPRFPSNFWGGLLHRHIVDAGTVLNGTLEDELSSKKSKIGDTFSILLADGYRLNNEQLIPQNAKIVGAVVSVTPASHKTNGVAGSVQISLQTLVLPDGASMPISASIMYNPNQPDKIDIKKGRGVPVGEYAKSLEYMGVYAAGSLTRTIGLPLPVKTQTSSGPDFLIKKGELLPVKLIQPLDMTAFMNSQPTSGNQSPNTQIPNTQVPNTQAPMMVPESRPPVNNGQVPGFNGAPGGQTNNWAVPGNQNASYPGGWPGNQPTPASGNNMLPGNNSPAGPEPF